MDFLFDILFEIYLELMMLVLPEKKAASKKVRVLSILIAMLALVGILALFVWGFVLLLEEDNLLGLIPVVLASMLSIAQIAAGIWLHLRKK